MSIYPSDEQIDEWYQSDTRDSKGIGTRYIIARKSAEHVARACAEVCHIHGRSDGNTCAKEILALIGQEGA
jgi:hypothetical protein